MFFRKKYLLGKIEGTYGSDSSPAAIDAILTTNLSINPYEGNRVSRNLDREYLGGQEEINTGPLVQIEFDVELAGAGSAAVTAGTPPPYGALLRACGLLETSTPTTDTVYTPVSTNFESVTLYYWLDGQQHKATGCRGTVSFNLARETIPTMRFSFQGNYNSPTSTASATPDTADFQDPLPVLDVNTSLTFFGQAVKTEQVGCELANNIVPRFLINGDEIIISDRAPTANLVFEAPALATYDFFAQMESHAGTSTGVLQVIHGTVTGNIVQIDAPQVQIASMSIQDSDGIVAYNASGAMIPTTAGNDEFTLTIK